MVDGKTLGAQPAHPWDERDYDGTFYNGNPGLTKRELFAAMVMQGILAGPCGKPGVPLAEWFDAPEQAVKLADALLAALSEPQA